MFRNCRRDRAPLALLLCSGLLLSVLGPRPATLRLVPTPAGLHDAVVAGLPVDGAAASLPSYGRFAGFSGAGFAGFSGAGFAGFSGAGFAGFSGAGLAGVGLAGVGLAGLAAVPGGGFAWPLDGVPRVVRPFDPPAQPWLAGHRGVDLAATPGATVRAAGPGQVRFAGQIAGRPVISIDHAGGLRTTYEPVEPVVRAGDQVSAGDPIGRLAAGHPGCAAAACLHWGLRRGDVYLDPLTLLGLGQVRLLPLLSPP
jgi:hypothetical protein